MLLVFLPLVAVLVAARIEAWRFDRRARRGMARVQGLGPGRSPSRVPGGRVSLPPDCRDVESYRLQQRGEMRRSPESAWMEFTAVQVLAVAEPAFFWEARFRAFQVHDYLLDGKGRLEARLLGCLPVARSSGAETTRAQMLRYLAEVPWAPCSRVANPYLTWEHVRSGKSVGVLEHGGQRVELRFFFDEEGDLRRVEGERERAVRGGTVATPWIGTFSRYRTMGGIRLPTYGEVRWILDSGPFTYWRGTITDVEVRKGPSREPRERSGAEVRGGRSPGPPRSG